MTAENAIKVDLGGTFWIFRIGKLKRMEIPFPVPINQTRRIVCTQIRFDEIWSSACLVIVHISGCSFLDNISLTRLRVSTNFSNIFFCFIPMKTSQSLLVSKDGLHSDTYWWSDHFDGPSKVILYKSHTAAIHNRPFNLHTDFSRVSPRPDFSRVLSEIFLG